jgi:hypothetical protein
LPTGTPTGCNSRFVLDDGALVEMVIWRVPAPTPGCERPHKYRHFDGRTGKRLAGYDNQLGTGDHRHVGKRQEPDAFSSVEALVRDFLADVAKRRST